MSLQDGASADSAEPENEYADIEFPCDSCGANMAWNPNQGALACEYCGHTQLVECGEGVILERALDDSDGAARGLGLELRVMRCDTCGARVSFEGSITADACVYCGSPKVLAQDANRNALRPESLVPLDVGRDQVEKAFRKWLKGLWFRPNAIKKVKKSGAVGVYVPFWTFDADVHSDWSADSGTYYYVTETYTTTVNGKRTTRTRQVRKTRWRPAWGSRNDHFNDFLVLGSSGQPGQLVTELGGFDLKELVPYKPQYLAGWRAEEYSIDLEQAWTSGQSGMVEVQRQRCSGDVPGDTQRNLRVQNTIGNVRWKHILLPIWSVQYRFGGKLYTVLVHGQSGKVVGKAPYSWVKILGLVLLIAGIAGAAVVIGGQA
ncbi:MAG: DNA-directed RNA polymerase subunit RPC12/RpoP [Candidatus Paceibacteria bacterium]|jgi:DNA-directed RNA polymerase subunit RPC12/RpoP